MSPLETTMDKPSSALSLRPKLSASPFAYMEAFRHLPMPTAADVTGRFHAEFLGPFWLRSTARPTMALIGLPRWWGKQLNGYGPAYNLLTRGDDFEQAMPMTLVEATSSIDGKPCATLRYSKETRFPWNHVTDELRVWDDGTLLALTRFDLPALRILRTPFLLVRK